jgi:zinc transport system substrate-binding protein
VEVVELWPAGADPRSRDPDGRSRESAAGSPLYVKVGADLERGDESVAADTRRGGGRVLELSEGAALIGLTKGEEIEGKIFSAALGLDGRVPRGNPFLWLDPVLVKGFVNRLLPALSEAFPDRLPAFQVRAERLLDMLDDLDQDIRERLASRKAGKIAAFTGTASYFCRRYGLDEIFVTGVTPGGGPGRTSLKGTVSLLRGLGVGAVFTGPLFPRQPAEAASSRAGVPLLVLEPFGAPGRGGYFMIMNHTLDLIEQGVSP